MQAGLQLEEPRYARRCESSAGPVLGYVADEKIIVPTSNVK